MENKEFKELTIEDLKNMEVGSVVGMGCMGCESLEKHVKEEDGGWRCTWCGCK